MFTAFALALAASRFPAVQVESPRLRTLLPNGSVLLAERMPEAKYLSVQLFAGVRGVEETPANHGWRHLLEHLILKGKDGTLDDRMERQGVFFVGRTYRDAMQIEFWGKPTTLTPMLAAVTELLQPLKTTPEAIAREVGIMGSELANQADASWLAREAWTTAFGDQGMDPLGDPAAMAKATPEELEELRKLHFAPSNLVLIISGPIDVDKVTSVARALLDDLDGPSPFKTKSRTGKPGRGQTDEAFGEVRGALVDGLEEGAGALCAAYAISSRLENAYVTYTPTTGQGLAIVGRMDANNTIGQYVDGLTEGEEAALMPIGKLLAERWLTGRMSTPSGSGYLRGLLLAQKSSARPEDLQEAVRKLDWPGFKAAMARFKKDRAVIAVGVR